MHKIEQFSLLTAVFAIVVLVVLGIFYAVDAVSIVFKAPLAFALGGLLIYGLCKVIRGSL